MRSLVYLINNGGVVAVFYFVEGTLHLKSLVSYQRLCDPCFFIEK